MTTYNAIQNKLSGNVIDIQGASTESGALLDAFPQKTTGNDNQLWDFVPDPAGSGFYFIKSKLSGNTVDIRGDSTTAGAGLDVYPQQNPGKSNQLWAFNPDPAGSGYFFIRSMLNGNVIDIEGASTKAGTLLDAFPQKTNGADNQLWKVVDGAFPAPVYTSISWGPEGTGPAPNSSTVGSGGSECAYQVSLSISQDGTCTFSGYYQNRGNVAVLTAPPQGFAVAFIVHDTTGKAYAFVYTGEVPSAPQSGSLITWNVTHKCPVIAENWYAIAAKNYGGPWVWNTHDNAFLYWLTKGLSDLLGVLANDIETAVEDIATALVSGALASLGAAAPITLTPLPPIPAGAPTGAAATLHQADARIVGKGK
jgi:hypothetical protein